MQKRLLLSVTLVALVLTAGSGLFSGATGPQCGAGNGGAGTLQAQGSLLSS